MTRATKPLDVERPTVILVVSVCGSGAALLAGLPNQPPTPDCGLDSLTRHGLLVPRSSLRSLTCIDLRALLGSFIQFALASVDSLVTLGAVIQMALTFAFSAPKLAAADHRLGCEQQGAASAARDLLADAYRSFTLKTLRVGKASFARALPRAKAARFAVVHTAGG